MLVSYLASGLRTAIGLGVLLSYPVAAGAQDVGEVGEGPRFLLVSVMPGRAPIPADASSVPLLRRRVTLEVADTPLPQVLDAIGREAGVRFAYSPEILATDRRVRIRAEELTLAAVLTEVLLDAGVDVLLRGGDRITLVPREAGARIQEGSVSGQVTNAESGEPVQGAEVFLEGTRWRTLTAEDGQYRLGKVEAGTYTIVARRIGYGRTSREVTVTAEQETTADFRLARSAHKLDEIVTTGTLVPTEVKQLPSPITVVTAADIQARKPRTLSQVFREFVPGAVAWDFGADPEQTAFSVRGASTLTPGGGQMKVFLDGLEVANPSIAAVDPSSIERMEVIRGPQAAAVYGSDAIGGVIQIFTKRGDPALPRPHVAVEAALGVAESPYEAFGSGSALRQQYSASLSGGGGGASYNVGGSYNRIGDWVPEGTQSLPSVHGRVDFDQGPLAVAVSGRHYVQNTAAVADPLLAATGYSDVIGPFFRPARYQEQTFGGHVIFKPKPWWTHDLRLGVDRFAQDVASTEPRFTSPSDSLLIVFDQNRTKTYVAYNTSVAAHLAANAAATLTAGIDDYTSSGDGFFGFGALNTEGPIGTPLDQPLSAFRNTTTNRGYFGQVQFAFQNALFVTAGVRAEDNSDYGADVGTPVSPRVGLAYAQLFRGTSVKLRGSFGRAIRAPSPGQRNADVTPFSIVLANPSLGPERQQGWDLGADLAIGSVAILSMTYYDQTARNLIDFALVDAATSTFQYQNVGRVRNRGLELEAGVTLGRARLTGQYAFTESEVEAVGPEYTGDLRVGEQVFLVPTHTGGALASLTPVDRLTVTAGIAIVGSWTYYDSFAQYRCFAGTGACRDSNRDYLIEYPSLAKVNVSAAYRIAKPMTAFLSVDNLNNSDKYEFVSGTPILGRVTMLGLRAEY